MYEFHWNIVFQKMPQLLNGAFVTLHVSVLSMLIGIAIAVLLAIAKKCPITSFLSSGNAMG